MRTIRLSDLFSEQLFYPTPLYNASDIFMAKSKLKKLMDSKGMTSYRLMKISGLPYAIVHKLVNAGEIPPRTSWDTLKKLRDALGVESVEDLEEEE